MHYVTREGWMARPPRKPWTRIKPKRVVGIVIHHSGVKDGPTGATAVSAFEKHHMDTRGWSSIAYNWLVDVDGTIYEGRENGAVGGATKNWNFKSESGCYIGDGFLPLTAEAVQGIRTVIDYLQNKYDNRLWVKAHRDFASTTCCGDWLYEWVVSGGKEIAPAGGVTKADTEPVDWNALADYVKGLGKNLESKPLKVGSRGKLVSHLQTALVDKGFELGAIDGIYGHRTAKAVKAFQKNRGYLKASGKVNRKTWDSLFFS